MDTKRIAELRKIADNATRMQRGVLNIQSVILLELLDLAETTLNLWAKAKEEGTAILASTDPMKQAWNTIHEAAGMSQNPQQDHTQPQESLPQTGGAKEQAGKDLPEGPQSAGEALYRTSRSTSAIMDAWLEEWASLQPVDRQYWETIAQAAIAWDRERGQAGILRRQKLQELDRKLTAISPADALERLRSAMLKDLDYAWSWHCNIAMACHDAGARPAEACNEGAARFLSLLFPGVDTTKHVGYPKADEFEEWFKGTDIAMNARGANAEPVYETIARRAWEAALKNKDERQDTQPAN